jgi:hypothetical protein
MCHRASASDREESAWVAAQEPPEPETTRLGHAECTSARFRADRRFCGECLRYVKWAVMCGLAAETLDASATCGRLKKHKGPEPTTSLVYRTISSKRVSEAPLLDEREGDKTKTSNSNHEPFSAIGKNSVRGRDVNERGGP